jgi:hypothetical protein
MINDDEAKPITRIHTNKNKAISITKTPNQLE